MTLEESISKKHKKERKNVNLLICGVEVRRNKLAKKTCYLGESKLLQPFQKMTESSFGLLCLVAGICR